MPKTRGSKNSASKHSLNPMGAREQPPAAHEQVQKEGEPQLSDRNVGQYSGRGAPPMQKK